MSNMSRYFDAYAQQRRWVGNAVSKCATEAAKLAKFKGSKGYDEELDKLRQERDNAIADAVAHTAAEFKEALAAMNAKLDNAPLVPPSEEQLRLVSALRMREHLSQSELERAAEQVGDNDASLALVMELAEKHNRILSGRKYGSRVNKAREAVAELGRAAKATLAWRGQTRAQLMESYIADRSNGLDAIGVADVEPTTIRETITKLGSIDPKDYDAVVALVD